jgi:hypothetical protein
VARGNHDTIADMKAGCDPVVARSIGGFECDDGRSEFKEELIHGVALPNDCATG